MNANAKEAIRDRLILAMNLSKEERMGQETRPLGQKRFHLLPLLTLNGKLPMPVIAVIMALMLGTGTTFAAENALPGEVLYPVKIHVNEEIREALAMRAEQKAEWELERAHRRAQEALKAQEQGKLDEALRKRMIERMREHEANSAALTEEVETKGNLQAAAHLRERMEAFLESEINVLEDVGVSDEELAAAKARREAYLKEQQEKYQAQLERRREVLQDQQETYEAQLERRRESLLEEQEKKQNLLERRREVLQEQQEKYQAQLERRREVLQDQQETYEAQLERRHNFLQSLKELFTGETQTEAEAEIEVEVEAEAESTEDANVNATAETNVDTVVETGTSILQ